MLFETLMQARDLVTVGGEAHWLVEGLPHLRPGDAGIDSNRLAAAQADEVAREHVERALRARLRDRDGLPPAGSAALRVLEKTSKN